MNRIHNPINIVNFNNSQNVLKDGSSVFVRILNTTDTPNKYIASFAGTMFEVSSKETLLPGNTFKATIKMQGKTLHLIPTTISDSKEIENQINKLDVKSFTQNNQQIIELLKNLNSKQCCCNAEINYKRNNVNHRCNKRACHNRRVKPYLLC